MTQENQNAIGQALGQPFFIHESGIASNLPIVAKFLRGDIESKEGKEPWREALTSISNPMSGVYSPKFDYDTRKWTFDYQINSDNNAVVLLPLRGAITKYDTWCSHGMLTFIDWLKAADSIQSVKGIVVMCDSPGGEATICEAVSKQMDIMSKPVYFHVHGMMASAAYYIGAKATRIYASGKTDIIGSIGTMITLQDYREYFKEMGINVMEIYADQSTDKNGITREALDGNPQRLKDEFLNPLAQMFIDYVSSSRPSVNKEVFTGNIYLGQKALEMKLIDGFKELQDVINEAAGIEQTTVQLSNNVEEDGEDDFEDKTTIENMNFLQTLRNLFGKPEASEQELTELVQANFEQANQNAELVARIDALEKGLQDANAKEVKFDTSNLVSIESFNAKVSALEKEIAIAKNIAVTPVSASNTEFPTPPATTPTAVDKWAV